MATNTRTPIEVLEALADEVSIQTERVHHEYTKYFSGAEKKPPALLRDQLEKKVDRLQVLQRNCRLHGTVFRIRNTIAKFTTYKALWDKKLLLRERDSTKA